MHFNKEIASSGFCSAVLPIFLCLLFLSARCADSTDNSGSSSDTDTQSENEEDSDTSGADCANEDEKYLSVERTRSMVEAKCPNLLLLNVVDEEFYSLGHIAGSLEIPWDELVNRLNEVTPDSNIVIYCRKGIRSESAYATLNSASYPYVWVMEGGIEAWIAAGYPVDVIP